MDKSSSCSLHHFYSCSAWLCGQQIDQEDTSHQIVWICQGYWGASSSHWKSQEHNRIHEQNHPTAGGRTQPHQGWTWSIAEQKWVGDFVYQYSQWKWSQSPTKSSLLSVWHRSLLSNTTIELAILLPSFAAARYHFLKHKDCHSRNDIGILADSTCHHTACRVWCSSRSDCIGFRVYNNDCYFKACGCLSEIGSSSTGDLYLKPWPVGIKWVHHHGSYCAGKGWSKFICCCVCTPNLFEESACT